MDEDGVQAGDEAGGDAGDEAGVTVLDFLWGAEGGGDAAANAQRPQEAADAGAEEALKQALDRYATWLNGWAEGQ